MLTLIQAFAVEEEVGSVEILLMFKPSNVQNEVQIAWMNFQHYF